MAAVVAISEKSAQPAPWQRSTRYSVTATLSVAAPQVRSIWVGPTGVRLSVPGAEGGSVSGGAGVEAVAVPE